jgi:hypothetical protein
MIDKTIPPSMERYGANQVFGGARIVLMIDQAFQFRNRCLWALTNT